MQRVTQMLEGVTTLDNFNMHIFKGEILGLVCVDTQGKQELINLIQHNTPILYGKIFYKNKLVNSFLHSPYTDNPVAVIDGNSRLVESLSIADNIFVLRKGFKKTIINPNVLNGQVAQFFKAAGMDLKGGQLVADLSIFEKCFVELIRAVVIGVPLVVVQDISNLISAAELEKFHNFMRMYAEKGVSFLYVCNHHEEAFTICGRVAIMEDGKLLRVVEKDNFSDDIYLIYSLDFRRIKGRAPLKEGGGSALSFKEVYTENLSGLSFSLEQGEIVVMLDGDNTSIDDITALLAREMPPKTGQVLVDGREIETCNRMPPVGIVKEAPTKTMVFQELDYFDNLCMLAAEKNPRIWNSKKLRKSIFKEYYGYVGEDLRCPDIRRLSQKSLYSLVYYRFHLYNPGVVVCVQPFFGADMYLRHHILSLINQLRNKGISVLILAVNVSDNLILADRMLLVKKGKLVAEYKNSEFKAINQCFGLSPT